MHALASSPPSVVPFGSLRTSSRRSPRLLRACDAAFDSLVIAGVTYPLLTAAATRRDKSGLVVGHNHAARSPEQVIGSAILANECAPS